MSDPQSSLDRLVRAAASTPPPDASSPPFGFTTRALAMARELRAADDDALVSFGWRATACACLAATLLAAASYRDIQHLTALTGTEFAWAQNATQYFLP